MTSGKFHPLPIICLTLLFLISNPANCQDIETLGRALVRAPPVTTAFVEYRFSRMLKRPARSSGVLEYRADGAMVRTVRSPRAERSEVVGSEVRVQRGDRPVQTIPLQRAPQLRILLASFRALLDGRLEALEQDFTLSLTGTGDSWNLELRPRDSRVAKYLSHIEVYGNGSQPHCLEANEPDGDATLTLFDSIEPRDIGGNRATLEQFCRAGSRTPARDAR